MEWLFWPGVADFAVVDISTWAPLWSLLVFFVFWTLPNGEHIFLHLPFLWQFHQVHHSVKEIGFAAHFRYHWMENILCKPMKTLAVMLLGGFEPEQAFIVHFCHQHWTFKPPT